jgi:hypothetical protein
MENRTGADETDSWNNLGGDAGMISNVLDGECVGKDGVHRGAEADKEIGSQSGWAMLELTLQSDQATQDCRDHQARDRDPDNGGHLVLEQVKNVLQHWHGNVSWLDSNTGKLDADVFLTGGVNGRDYRAEPEATGCVQ